MVMFIDNIYIEGSKCMYLEAMSTLKEYIENLKVESSEQLMLLVAENSASEVDELINYLNSKNISFLEEFTLDF